MAKPQKYLPRDVMKEYEGAKRLSKITDRLCSKKPKTRFFTSKWMKNLRKIRDAHQAVYDLLNDVGNGTLQGEGIEERLKGIKKDIIKNKISIAASTVAAGASLAAAFVVPMVLLKTDTYSETQLISDTIFNVGATGASFLFLMQARERIKKAIGLKEQKGILLDLLKLSEAKKIGDIDVRKAKEAFIAEEMEHRLNEINRIDAQIGVLHDHHEENWGKLKGFKPPKPR
ncbi:MAG: hypothetical protein KAW41_01790 [Candidatus Diapherotrites archaeon]|nr:hypothetical protein [Candidatus Diapherotrites archaeon]